MTADRLERRVRWASVFSLGSLAFIVWSIVDPRPLPVVAAMSVGQIAGTLAFVAYLTAVFVDLRRAKLLPSEKKEAQE